MSLLETGQYEALKGSVHLALFTLCGVCAVYNVARLVRTGSEHNAFCAWLYTSGMAWEAGRVKHHWERL